MTLAIKTTVGDLIAMTQSHLYGASKDQLNILDGTINASVTTVTVEDTIRGAAQGTLIAIDDELMYVRNANTSTNSFEVIRGFRGTTAAIHTDGAIIEVEPRFPRPIIRALLREEIASWPEGLFRVATVTLTLGPSSRGYDLTGIADTFYWVLGADLSPDSSDAAVHSWGQPPTFKVLRGLPTTEFASGTALIFDRSWNDRSAVATVAMPFDLDAFSDGTLLSDIGLSESMANIAAYGVAWRLMATAEVQRTSLAAMGQPSAYESVPPMYRAQTGSSLKKVRDALISEEMSRLRAKYPVRVG